MMDSISPHKCNCGFRKSGLSFIKMKDMEDKKQIGGDHYLKCGIMPTTYIRANNLDFFEGNIIKYATRHKEKGGAEDIKKVIHYAEMILEDVYGFKKEEGSIVMEDYDSYFKGVDRIKEGSDCIGVFTCEEQAEAFDGLSCPVEIKEGESILVDRLIDKDTVLITRQNGESLTMFCDTIKSNFKCKGIAPVVDLKKKGLTERQIKDILNK